MPGCMDASEVFYSVIILFTLGCKKMIGHHHCGDLGVMRYHLNILSSCTFYGEYSLFR